MSAFDEMNKIDCILITIGEFEYMIPRRLISEEEIVSELEHLRMILLDKKQMAIHDLIIKGISEKTILKGLKEGVIYSPKHGYVGLL